MIPNRTNHRWNPLVHGQFILYTVLNTAIAIADRGRRQLSWAPVGLRFTRAEARAVAGELAIVLLLQLGCYILAGSFVRYLWLGPGAIYIASAILSTYIATNHYLNPIMEHSDPVLGALSVAVPGMVDRLHDNFSFHAEHHLFPGMNPKWYPEVSRLLAVHFPERYDRLPFSIAWEFVWNAPPHAERHQGRE